MNTKNTGEPTMNNMDDYNGNESPKKRKTINIIIFGLLAVGLVLAIVRLNDGVPSDYVGTPDKPGINTSKGFTH